ncbi:MAG: methyl-accepting chemotaxis protein [Pseudorhizobium sp.]
MKLSIARSLAVFGAVVCFGMATSVGIQTKAFNDLRVNGPAYHQIVNGKDLVADILPPPLYVVESYMLALEAAADPARAQMAGERITDVLAPDYEARRSYWQASDLQPALKTKLLDEVLVKGDVYWKILQSQIIPILASSDPAERLLAFSSLSQAFHDHEDSVVELVEAAVAFQAASEAAAADETRLYTRYTYIAAAASLLILLAGLFALRRRAIVPLAAMRDYMAVLASGDYGRPVPYEGRSDEIGAMARAVTVFREAALERNASRKQREADQGQQIEMDRRQMAQRTAEGAERANVINLLGGSLERLAKGDLACEITQSFATEYEQLRAEFNSSIRVLAQTLGEISIVTATVHGGTNEIATATDELAKRTEAQAASLEQAAAALDQITTTVKTASDRAMEANRMVALTKESAERSSSVMSEAVAAMEKIEESSAKISQIINVIDQIAFQTNLLALNAGVEAARAGEAGRGFAVVAQEVRELAGRSANAAKEIKALIHTSSSQVASGVSLVNRTGQALGEIDSRVQSVDGLIATIVQAATEQATALAEVNGAVNRMDQVTQKNAAMVEETSASCRDLSGQALNLNTLIARFQLAEQQVRQRTPAPAALHEPGPPSRPVASPARALGRKIAGAFGGPPRNAAAENWEEF